MIRIVGIMLVAGAREAHSAEHAASHFDDERDPVNRSIDLAVDTLFQRMLRTSNLEVHHHADLDETAIGKSSHLAGALQRGKLTGVTLPHLRGPERQVCGNVFSSQVARSMYSALHARGSELGNTFTSGFELESRRQHQTRRVDAPAVPAAASKAAASDRYVRPWYKGVKQVVTLGPASFSKERIMELFLAGADVFRINLGGSVSSYEVAQEVMGKIREVESDVDYPIGVIADLQGPKFRIGAFKDGGQVELKVGDRFRLDSSFEEGDQERVQLPHPELLRVMTPGISVLIDHGKVRMKVVGAGQGFVECVVFTPGTINSRKGVTVPDVELPIQAITAKDERDLNFIMDFEPDFVALSLTQRAKDITQLQRKIAEHPNRHKPKVMAKLERPLAVENLVDIVEVSDAIMVERGDLGVEMDVTAVPLVQKQVVSECRKQGKPVIIATEMLESMVTAPIPTRAESSDVAAAVFDGVDAVMLSAESAVGQFPRESVEVQRMIINRMEGDPLFQTFERSYTPVMQQETGSDADCVVTAVKVLAENLRAKSIIVLTSSGTTAQRLSRLHTQMPVLAVTPSLATARSLTLSNHVYPALLTGEWDGSRKRISVVIDEAVKIAQEKQLLNTEDDRAVLMCGLPFNFTKGLVNFIRVLKGVRPDYWKEECDSLEECFPLLGGEKKSLR
eukprot:gnl/TRDRNA2_/TRDRNA2_81020_c0_seq1.p1 gnl/TRDRNA2_/TRDRNA2_81020_c0~~gnl/TRDRNA2_/TRDRNA2_81020_c0_seq1.p1  ORF type:complete len:678 (+),score=117.13 gnl/TRDRNA2_/TRDRNA2_81020_c0_seq1:73-2106(+)